MKQAYIFRGPPAAGKGTIVAKFAEQLGVKVVYLDLDVFRWNFHLIGRRPSEVSPDEHRLAFVNLLTILERYCHQSEYTIVVDGLFTWDDESSSEGSVKAIAEILHKHGYAYKSILLTAAKDELEARNQARAHAVPQAEFDRLYTGVMSKIGPDEIVIDSTGQVPEQTLAQTRGAVR